jgi:peptidoglycan/LPS O-acetylase OafA/YrhL
LRGVAALIVVIEHASALLPVGEWHIGSGLGGEAISSLLNLPFRGGNLAVYVFFVLSGLVVSNAARGKPWPLSLVSRYVRLTTPMLVASLMAWILLLLFPSELPIISAFKPNYWTTSIYQGGAQTLWLAIKEPLFGTYALQPKPYLNPVLWSMRAELWGSFGIFTFYRFVPTGFRVKALVVAAAILLISGLWVYLAFAVGVAFYESKLGTRLNAPMGASILTILVGFTIGALAPLSAFRYYSQRITHLGWFEADLKILICTAGASLIVAGVVTSERSRTNLMQKIPQFLGRISYGLYLTHMPILYTVFAAIYLNFGQPPSTPKLMLWASLFIVASLSIGYVITIFVDEPITRFVKIRRQPEGNKIP